MINIFKLSTGLQKKVSKHLTMIASISALFFCLTFFGLYTMFFDNMLWYIYGFWGIGGLIITRKGWPELIIVLLDWPFFIWICFFIYIFAVYYYINDYKYSTEEFFYNNEFDDYRKL